MKYILNMHEYSKKKTFFRNGKSIYLISGIYILGHLQPYSKTHSKLYFAVKSSPTPLQNPLQNGVIDMITPNME